VAAQTPLWQRAVPWGAGVAVGAIVAALAVWSLVRPAPPAPHLPTLLGFSPPESAPLWRQPNSPPLLALSPDGTQVVYVAEVAGSSQLYLRPLGRLETTPMPGTEGAKNPFFSPDGRWLGFWQEGQLKKVFLEGGQPYTLCDAPVLRGASWGLDDTILFTPEPDGGIWHVSAEGGTPRAVTTPNRDAGEGSHRWPQILPGGRAALFTITVPSGRLDEARIALLSLETAEWKVLFQGGSVARYMHTGHVVYASGGSLLAAPFDVERLEVMGPALPVLEDIRMNAGTGMASAHFDVSSTGSLAYIPGYPRPSKRSLVWVDRQGTAEPATQQRRAYWGPRLSPDGTRLAVNIESSAAKSDVWVVELLHEGWTRLTFQEANHLPRWSPDGRRLVFASNREGPYNLFWVPADGSAPPERLTSSPDWQFPASWSPDGRHLAFQQNSESSNDIWVLELDGDHGSRPYLATPFHERNAEFSPDGRWLAYHSNESGRYEVYVRPFPGPGQKWPISRGGGREPVWSRDGRELFYRSGDQMMVAAVQTEPTFRTGPPRVLFERLFVLGGSPGYDVSPDGQRFLMIQEAEEQPERLQIVVIPDWFEELKRLVPTER